MMNNNIATNTANFNNNYGYVGPVAHMVPITYYVMSPNAYESYYLQYPVMDGNHQA